LQKENKFLFNFVLLWNMLRVYNTLHRKKEKFEPLHKNFVGMYVCGPTVYDYCHIGHAKTAISFDIIRRYLAYEGYNVFYISNITDVGHIVNDADIGEDKIEKRAKERKLAPMELADFYIRNMWEDYDALKIKRPNISPRATGHIVEIIEAVKTILDKGHAYEFEGNVYFDVDEFLRTHKRTDFGKLSHRKIKKQLAGVRNKVAPGKKKPYDFALWKKATKEHIMQWQSPWGKGFPGWHIECTVMSTKYLGQPFDIHGGGIEHAMLHHECEILQAEALKDKKFVRYFLHTGLLNVNGQKMSKSKGNFITIKEILKDYSPETVRMLVVQNHYRKPLNYTKSTIISAYKNVEKVNKFWDMIKNFYGKAEGKYSKSLSLLTKQAKNGFVKSMQDDFNTPEALACLLSYISQVNKLSLKKTISKRNAKEIIDFLNDVDSIFAVLKEKEKPEPKGLNISQGVIGELLELREKLREKGEYQLADQLRTILNKAGIYLEDTPQGPRIVRKALRC